MRKYNSFMHLYETSTKAFVPVLAAAAVTTLLTPSAALALDDGAVVTSIKPVHSLVAAVMEGVGTPHLIVRGGASPHTYSLRPSDARSLQNAKAVFWIGEEMEAFLAKPVESLGQNAKLVTLSEAHDLTKLKFREGGPFEGHDHGEGHDHEEAHEHEDEHHDEHDHDEHDHDAEHADADKHEHAGEHDHADEQEHAEEHDHEKDHDQAEEHEHAEEHDHEKDHDHAEEHEHEKEHDHAEHGEIDMHLWLDPENAKAMLHEIEETLVALDPANAAAYEANAENYAKRIDALTSEITADLAPVRAKSFIVFHDAYQYFENRFGVTAAGSITVSPEVIPGAQRVAEIQGRVKALGDTCVFAEPQFEPKLVKVVTEGTSARSGVLDPLGTELDGDGPELYLDLIRTMASSIGTCLAGES